MKDYTEKLKKYWKTDELAFVAIFKKINSEVGFFNHFTNPVTKVRIFYPSFSDLIIKPKKSSEPKLTGNVIDLSQFTKPKKKKLSSFKELNKVEVLDKRVSFYYAKARGFNDGDYFKVELQHTNNPMGKNNPYSLEIKKVSKLNQHKINELLNKKINNTFINIVFNGTYKKVSDQFACFQNVIFADSGNILVIDGEYQNVFISPSMKLKNGDFYSFSISKSDKKLPIAVQNSIKKIDVNPYKKVIDERFRLHHNPASNKTNAKTMREIGIGMYSSKERMIYELLQNADDSPGKEKVEFHIDMQGDYFFVMHDGAPFNRNDVEAITSGGESTKEKSEDKTGYKGIGFKSVFTNSTEVWIKSGGYQFAFIKDSELFKDFDSLYFPEHRKNQFTKEGLETEKEMFKKHKLEFDCTVDIPWQLMPIWKNKLPEEFRNTNFDNFPNPVQFALKLGENNIAEYKKAINSIAERPQFLLFLRNTSKFNSPKNGLMILREDNGDLIRILKSKPGEKLSFYYTKKYFQNIEVNDDAFENCGIGLKIVKEYNENLKTDKNYFIDIEGNKIDEIPPKLASVTKTEISFGIKVKDNKVIAEEGYLEDSQDYSSLFTYLPMEDKRFKLPFLVNANFIPDSRRENLLDNPWNEYLIIKVAEKHISTLANFAQNFQKNNIIYKSYLSLLLKKLIPVDKTAENIIASYNNKYLNNLSHTKIIVNDKNELQLLSDTIIDTSGLTELFGHDIFYKIILTDKKLPHTALDNKYLIDYEYIDIATINLEELSAFLTIEKCKAIGDEIDKNKLFENPNLMKWLNKLVKYTSKLFNEIPFIPYNKSLYCLNLLIDETDVWIINDNTLEYEKLLGELNYHTVNLYLDKFTYIKHHLHTLNGYLNDRQIAYDRIAANDSLGKLEVNYKIKLIDFMKNSDFMRGIGETKYLGELEIFVDELNHPRPLNQLLNREDDLPINSLHSFRIIEQEFLELPTHLKNVLISKKSIFSLFILNSTMFNLWTSIYSSKNINNYVSSVQKIFSWLPDSDSISAAQWASIPWLYIDDKTRFKTADNSYWSIAFDTLTTDKFNTIKKLIDKITLKILPMKQCGSLIKTFKLKTDDGEDIEWASLKKLNIIEANSLLDWLENDGAYSEFFKKYTLTLNKSTFDVEAISNINIYDSSDIDFENYIQKNEELSSYFSPLDKRLCCENRFKIGLLQGDKLLRTIIDTEIYDQSLAIMLPRHISLELLMVFINNLPELSLYTDKKYDNQTPEHFILNNLIKNIDKNANDTIELNRTIEQLRSKITLNEKPLSNYNISNRVTFGIKEKRKVLSLSSILDEYKGDSDELEKVKEAFVDIRKDKLKNIIFKTKQLSPGEIYTKIESEKKPYYSVAQVVFQLIDYMHGGKRNWKKVHFDDFFIKQGDIESLYSSYAEFMEEIFKLQIPFTGKFYSYEVDLKQTSEVDLNNTVEKNFSIKREVIPSWLNDWATKNEKKHFDYLRILGYNGPNSSIVKLRKAMVGDKFNEDTVVRYFMECKDKTQLIWNTIEWLTNYNQDIITRNISIIQRINNSINLNVENITIPVIKSINTDGKRLYNIVKLNISQPIKLLPSNTEFGNAVFNSLNTEDTIIIDENIGGIAKYFKNIDEIQINECIDIEKLESNSKPWDEPYYKKWEFSDKCPIYIYDGTEIPFYRIVDDNKINSFTRDLKIFCNDVYFISNRLIKDVLNNLPVEFPDDKLSDLKNWHYQTLQDETLLDEDSFEYKEEIDRLCQDRLGISPEKQKTESNSAKTHAIYYLEENGYNVSKVNNIGSMLTDIVEPNGHNINCLVRSAKGGLLYINKEHWDMFEDDKTYLVCIYPGNSPRLFKNQLELLDEELAENVLFRIPNNRQTSEIDGVFDTLESESHLILVTSEKMKESIFSKIKNTKGNSKEVNSAIGDDNFSLDD